MPALVDASSPPRVSATVAPGNLGPTTASFTAPADSLLLAHVTLEATSNVGSDLEVTDTGGLTWSLLVSRDQSETIDGGYSAWWMAIAPSAASRTVSVDWSGPGGRGGTSGNNRPISLKVYVVTGADVDGTPVDTVTSANEGSSTVNSMTTTSVTPGANGLLFVGDFNYASLGGHQASSDLTQEAIEQDSTVWDSGGYTLDIMSGYKAVSSGVAATGNINAGGTGTAQHEWVQVVVREAAGGSVEEEASYSAASEFGSTFSAVATAAGSITAGVTAGAALSARAAASASITEAIEAGDTDAAIKAVLSAFAAQVSVDEQYAAIAQAVAAIQAGLEAGEEWAAIAAAEAGLTAGISVDATFSFASQSTQSAALSAGTHAAAEFLGAVSAFALLSSGVSAGDAFSASARISASISAGVTASASLSPILANDGIWTAATSLQAEFQSVSSSIASMSGASALQDAYDAVCAALASLTAGVVLGATFSASSSADISISGAVASVRAIRMSASVKSIGPSASVDPIRPKATLN